MSDEERFQPSPPAHALDWERVLAFLPVLADPGFNAGHVVDAELQDDGAYSWPYAAPSETLAAFVRTLYDSRVVESFDWPGWMRANGQTLMADPGAIANASLEDCRRLLAAYVRGDRFNDGLLISVAESGVLVAILERIRELTQQ
jgi:hypothetical protein